jgi:hypothetical protein
MTSADSDSRNSAHKRPAALPCPMSSKGAKRPNRRERKIVENF